MFCPRCNIMLIDSDQSAKWIHDIFYHREEFEKQIEELTKEQIIDNFCIIVKRFCVDEN